MVPPERRAGRRLAAAVLVATVAAGCSTTPTTPVPPSDSPTAASPSARVVRDFTKPGEAQAIIGELVTAAGTINAIKVEISKDAASLSTVIGMTATTHAWRDGRIVVVDSDTQYVGQAIFDPRDFKVDVARMFGTAAVLSGSKAEQQLQIVEYNDLEVYVTVTTNPESRTVFFRKDGTLVDEVDLFTQSGIAAALADVTAHASEVVTIGVLPGQGLYADVAAGTVTSRTLRMSRFPSRTTVRPNASTLTPFDADLVSAKAIIGVIADLPKLTGTAVGTPYTLVIQRPTPTSAPVMKFTVDGKDVTATLDGSVLHPR